MKAFLYIALSLVFTSANAQWQILNSQTNADLHGVDALGDGVVWVSGSHGTVLRTPDGGHTWTRCATPAGAADSDFRGVQAFNEKSAVIMSGGKGSLSHLYKTADGCRTWQKVFDNPSSSGGFESLHRVSAAQMYLLGDAVNGKLALFSSGDSGNTWSPVSSPGLEVPGGGTALGTASMTHVDWLLTFGTAGRNAAVYTFNVICRTTCTLNWIGKTTPLAGTAASAGVYSVAGRTYVGPPLPSVTGDATSLVTTLVAVGGDREHPAEKSATAAVSNDGGATWKPAGVPPGGFRSAVAFDVERERFIAVGPNGTDVSTDDGISWRPLMPRPGDIAGSNQNWNALSLPFAVGSNGRIGLLHDAQSTSSRDAR